MWEKKVKKSIMYFQSNHMQTYSGIKTSKSQEVYI